MYSAIVLQATQALKNVEVWLDKADQHAVAKNFDVGVLMSSRIAPDMKGFTYQMQSACDYEPPRLSSSRRDARPGAPH